MKIKIILQEEDFKSEPRFASMNLTKEQYDELKMYDPNFFDSILSTLETQIKNKQ